MSISFFLLQDDKRGWKEIGDDHGLNIVEQGAGPDEVSQEPDDLKEARGKLLTAVRVMRSGAMQLAQGLQNLEEAVGGTPLAGLHPAMKKALAEMKVHFGKGGGNVVFLSI